MTIEIPSWLISMTFFAAYWLMLVAALLAASTGLFKILKSSDVFWCFMLLLYMRKRGVEKFTVTAFRHFCTQLRDENPRVLKGVTDVAMTYQRFCTDEQVVGWERREG